MFAIKAKIYGVLYNQSSSIALMKHLVIGQHQKLLISWHFIGQHKVVWFPLVSICNHKDSTFTENDRKTSLII